MSVMARLKAESGEVKVDVWQSVNNCTQYNSAPKRIPNTAAATTTLANIYIVGMSPNRSKLL